MERKIKKELVERFSAYDLDGTIDEAIQKLQDLKDAHGPDLTLDVEYDYYDETTEIAVYTERPETDEEFQRRKDRAAKAAETRRRNAALKAEQAAAAAAAQEENERELYEKLRAKFEKASP